MCEWTLPSYLRIYNFSTYLYYSGHHSLCLRQINWSLLFLLGQWLIHFVSIEVKVEKGSVVTLGIVKFIGTVLVGLQGYVLLRGNSIAAVQHHLGQDLIHKSVLLLGGVGNYEILNGFLMTINLKSTRLWYLFLAIEWSDKCQTRLKFFLLLESLLSQSSFFSWVNCLLISCAHHDTHYTDIRSCMWVSMYLYF